MDSRTAAHALTHVAALLELRGENRFKSRAYEQAARAVRELDTDDLGPLLRDGRLEAVPGLGPATMAVLRDLVVDGESALLTQLQAGTPDGLLAMLRIPHLGAAKIHAIHRGLDVSTVDELEAAARDGRLATIKGFGPKTVEKVLQGIEFVRRTGEYSLYPRAAAEAARIVETVLRHPDVERAEAAGSVRRRAEVVRDVDVVAACRDPEQTARSLANAPGVREVSECDGTLSLRFVDGTLLDLTCVAASEWAVALWRATGSLEHVREVEAHAATRGFSLGTRRLLAPGGAPVPLDGERALYAALGLAYVPPELREGRGEVEAAARGALPRLVEPGDVRGVVHCHSSYSDGGATIREMADAAVARGWSYLGITDHSESAFYAGGMRPADVLRQHREIESINERLAADGSTFRVLKGIEADILPDGRVDYDDETLLARFDYVIGSIHSRFGMGEAEMTARVLRALDSPFLTILGHPTGRLLLQREPFAIDMHAVLEKAAETGACVELNADPHRLDLDWRLCRRAKELGVPVEIGPDAHSPAGLDNVAFGVGIARKGWLEASDILNARSADDVLAFARAKRER